MAFFSGHGFPPEAGHVLLRKQAGDYSQKQFLKKPSFPLTNPAISCYAFQWLSGFAPKRRTKERKCFLHGFPG
jgi:hypothetical protein